MVYSIEEYYTTRVNTLKFLKLMNKIKNVRAKTIMRVHIVCKHTCGSFWLKCIFFETTVLYSNFCKTMHILVHILHTLSLSVIVMRIIKI